MAHLPVQVAEESGTDLAQAVRRRLRVKEKQATGSSTAGKLLLFSGWPPLKCNSLQWKTGPPLSCTRAGDRLRLLLVLFSYTSKQLRWRCTCSRKRQPSGTKLLQLP